jgi:hypothetical protein
MTVDRKWASSSLTECLLLENFANFLRGAKEIDDIKFYNDDPDLELRDD